MLGQEVLSFIERFPLFGGLNCTGIIGTGKSTFVLRFFIRRLKCTGIIGIGTSRFVLYREVSFIRRLKCTGIIGIGTSRFVLYREVFFIRSVL